MAQEGASSADSSAVRAMPSRAGSSRFSTSAATSIVSSRDDGGRTVMVPPALPATARTPSGHVRPDTRRHLLRNVSSPILYQGVLKKRTTRAGNRLGSWYDKLFVLRSASLEFYNKNQAVDGSPKATYSFCGGCEISAAVQEVRSGGRVLYVFRLEWPRERENAKAGSGDRGGRAGSAGAGSSADGGASLAAAAAAAATVDTDGEAEEDTDGSGRRFFFGTPEDHDGVFFGGGDTLPPVLPGSPGQQHAGNANAAWSGQPNKGQMTGACAGANGSRGSPLPNRLSDQGARAGVAIANGGSGGNGGVSAAGDDGTIKTERHHSGAWLLRKKSGTSVLTQRRNGARGGTQEETRNETIQSLVDAQIETRRRASQFNEVFVEQFLERELDHEKEPRQKDFRQKIVTGAKIGAAVSAGVAITALTAGAGLVLTLAVVGVAAGTTSAGGIGYFKLKGTGTRTGKPLVLASETREVAEEWRARIEAQLRSVEAAALATKSLKGQRRGSMSAGGVLGSFGCLPPTRFVMPAAPETNLQRVDKLLRHTSWVSRHVVHGIRIFEEEGQGVGLSLGSALSLAGGAAVLQEQLMREMPFEVPTFKAQVPVRASPLETFLALMASPRGSLNGVVNSLRVVESVDDHSDVIHTCVRQAWVGPSWTSPRDFCLARHWRLDDEGCYIVCLDSVSHPSCPQVAGHVRAEMSACYTIAPRKDDTGYSGEANDCLLTHYLRVDPRGWVWRKFGCTRRYNLELMMHILDVRDVIEAERFATPAVCLGGDQDGDGHLMGQEGGQHSGNGFDPNAKWLHSASRAAEEEEAAQAAAKAFPWAVQLATMPHPALRRTMWAEADGTGFQVRGPSYDVDHVKVVSAPQMFRLVAVDLFEASEPVLHIASRPDNRVRLARKMGETSFVWILQIMVPGPPYYAFTSYFTPTNPDCLKEDAPFGRLARPFFFGEDDNFRNERLKLIPKVVEGNWVVKRAAGNTPAILGTKLRQVHFRGDNYLETDVDIGSSSVAASVTRLSVGYAKALVVDMAWTLQGNTEEELPEVVMAGVRCNRIDMSTAQRLPPLDG